MPNTQEQQVTSVALPRLAVADGTIEALKWFALLLMTLDHINKYLFSQKLPFLFEVGRLALPLFGFVLAYNLARPGVLKNRVYGRVLKRLALYGILASPMYVALVGWWPLNILFMLFLAATMMYLTEKAGVWRAAAAVMIFIVGGGIVEFWWFAIVMCVAAWRYCKRASWPALLVWITSLASLYIINRNFWALAALPLIFLAPHVRLELPRWKHVFYVYFPAHLLVLWIASKMMVGNDGQ